MINDRSSIHLYWWMMKLGLNLTELMVYATIYSFTNGTSDHCYRGSATYLGERAQIQRRSVYRILSKLEERWLIQRKERYVNGVRFVDYYTDYGDATKVTGDDASVTGDDVDVIGEMTPVSPNNNSIDNNSNNSISSPWKKLIDPKEKLAPQDEDISMPGPVAEFLQDSYKNFPSVRYQIDKQWSKYFMCNLKDLDKLKKEYGAETVYAVLKFIKQDPFWSKQIQTIGKLRKKNKDWIPYMVVMLEKMQQWKPKVLDLDSIVIWLS